LGDGNPPATVPVRSGRTFPVFVKGSRQSSKYGNLYNMNFMNFGVEVCLEKGTVMISARKMSGNLNM